MTARRPDRAQVAAPRRAPRGNARAAAAPPRRNRRQGVVLGAMITSIACVGVLFVGPFPVRTWWSQRNDAAHLQQQIDVLHEANTKLRTRVKELDDPATVRALARRDYGMVRKGESAYAVLPPPVPANRLPQVWPFVALTESGSARATGR